MVGQRVRVNKEHRGCARDDGEPATALTEVRELGFPADRIEGDRRVRGEQPETRRGERGELRTFVLTCGRPKRVRDDQTVVVRERNVWRVTRHGVSWVDPCEVRDHS